MEVTVSRVPLARRLRREGEQTAREKKENIVLLHEKSTRKKQSATLKKRKEREKDPARSVRAGRGMREGVVGSFMAFGFPVKWSLYDTLPRTYKYVHVLRMLLHSQRQ